MTSFLRHPKVQAHLQQIWKFMIAGGTGAVIDFSLLNFFTWFFGIDPRVANVFSTLVASIVVFLINKFFAFRHREGNAATQAARFAVAYAIAYVLNVLFTALFITIGFHFFSSLPQTLISNVSKALAIGVVMFWNYFLLHSFVFRQKKQAEEVMTTGV